MRLHKHFSNEDCIGKGCSASIGLGRDWVDYSEEVVDENDGDKVLQAEGHYRDVYVLDENEVGLLAYCDGEYVEIVGFDEAAQTVTLRNDDCKKETGSKTGGGRALSEGGYNAYIFTIPYEQFAADFSSFYEMEFCGSGPFDPGKLTELVCFRCRSSVFKSENPEYVYECRICDEDLYSFETRLRTPPIVEGVTNGDTGFKDGFSDELCGNCDAEVYNIPNNRVSLCPSCNACIMACNCCDSLADGHCSWDGINLRCDHFNYPESWKIKLRKRDKIDLEHKLRPLDEKWTIFQEFAIGPKKITVEMAKIFFEIEKNKKSIKELDAAIIESFVNQCIGLPKRGKAHISWLNRDVHVFKDEERNELFDVILKIKGKGSDDNDHSGIHLDELGSLVGILLWEEDYDA